ncbi:MAG: hypothetical protein AABZ55_08025 [Bdellovibrionota bacterium]
MRFALGLAVLALTLGAAAKASEDGACSPVRLDKKGGSIEHVPVLEQDGLPLCYSFAGAAAIDAYRFSHGDRNYKHLTSPFFHGLNNSFIREKADEFREPDDSLNLGGDSCIMINQIRKTGSCSRDAVGWTLKGLEWKKYLKYLAEFYEFRREYQSSQKYFKEGSGSISERYIQGQVAASKDFLACQKSLGVPVPEGLTPEFIAALLEQDNPFKFLKESIGQACSGKNVVPVSMPECTSMGNFSTDSIKYRKLIHRWLDLPDMQPLGIDLSTKVLTRPKGFRGINRITGTEIFPGSHAALIIGRRKNPKTKFCQFLVRLSWGKDPTGYAKEWTFTNGNLWVDAEDLSENIFGLWAIGGLSRILQQAD